MCATRQIINNAWAGIKLLIEVPPPDTSENQKSGNSRGKPSARGGCAPQYAAVVSNWENNGLQNRRRRFDA